MRFKSFQSYKFGRHKTMENDFEMDKRLMEKR